MNNILEKLRSIGWQKMGLSILCGVLALILILMLFATAFINKVLDQVSSGGHHVDGTMSSSELNNFTATLETVDPDYTGETVDPSDVTMDTIGSTIIDNEYAINILLVGQDRRPGEGRTRSDSMILCSFNTKTGGISMISFLRDTYVSIPGYWPDKMNAAYAYGGMKTLKETMAVNFGVHVDGCVEVDFSAFKAIIDRLGGVDISLTQKEVDYLNAFGNTFTPGMNHLDGAAALDYARIRKIDMDSKRAERQRKVIMALIDKYKDRNVVEMATIAMELLDYVRTDLPKDDIINYVMQLFPMLSSSDISSHQIPVAGTYNDVKVLGTIVDVKVIKDMATNRELLEKLLG